MKLRITNGMELAVLKNEAEKRNHPCYLIHMDYPTVMDEKARRGYEQYPALKCNPDGSFEVIKAAPKS